ncbi:MAG: DUF1292 domain-containing protein [Firmicutes bacterium]|nr:DUF1292 domain-containing protein [Bacillota bacterium]
MKAENKQEEDKLFEGFEDILSDEEVYEAITMTDDNGDNIDYFIVDAIDVDGIRYLLIVRADEFDEVEPECELVKESADDGEEVVYDIVEDEAEYNKVMILLQDNENNDYEMKF